MSFLRSLVLVTLFCGLCAGCGSAKISELSAEIVRLKEQVAKLEAEKNVIAKELAALQQAKAQQDAELAQARTYLQQVGEIRQGYETARAKFAEQLKQLAPMLGIAGSPLPPFEQLKDSSWVGKLAPGTAGAGAGMKDLEKEINNLLDPGKKP